MLLFNTEEFFEVFARYNAAIWPAQADLARERKEFSQNVAFEYEDAGPDLCPARLNLVSPGRWHSSSSFGVVPTLSTGLALSA